MLKEALVGSPSWPVSTTDGLKTLHGGPERVAAGHAAELCDLKYFEPATSSNIVLGEVPLYTEGALCCEHPDAPAHPRRPSTNTAQECPSAGLVKNPRTLCPLQAQLEHSRTGQSFDLYETPSSRSAVAVVDGSTGSVERLPQETLDQTMTRDARCARDTASMPMGVGHGHGHGNGFGDEAHPQRERQRNWGGRYFTRTTSSACGAGQAKMELELATSTDTMPLNPNTSFCREGVKPDARYGTCSLSPSQRRNDAAAPSAIPTCHSGVSGCEALRRTQ